MEKLRKAPSPADLQGDRVHVWFSDPENGDDDQRRFHLLLNAEERDRLSRYRFSADRVMFAAGQGALRFLLGYYASVEPSSVELVPSRVGQPLPAPGSPAGIFSFSVSHSGGRILLAFSRGIRVGIDVERVREDVDIEGIARRYFAPAEFEALRSHSQHRRREAFFAVWTRKEAFLKARGEGLSCPLSSFAVSVEPAAPPHLIQGLAGAAAVEWSIHDLDAGSGYRAALAVNHPSPLIGLYDFRSTSFPVPERRPFLRH